MTTRQRVSQSVSQTFDSWDTAQKALAFALACGGLFWTSVSAYHALAVAPLAARLDKADAAQIQAQRDRADVLQAIGRVETQVGSNTAALRDIRTILERRR